MNSKEAYEKQIADEIRVLPPAALAEVLRLITAVREKYRARSAFTPARTGDGSAMHSRTRQFLASSKGNWAQDLIREREDGL
jgi:hypothetical protein